MKVEIRVDVREATGGKATHVLELEVSRGDGGIPERRITPPTFVTCRVDGDKVSSQVFRDVIAMCQLGRWQQ